MRVILKVVGEGDDQSLANSDFHGLLFINLMLEQIAQKEEIGSTFNVQASTLMIA